MKAMEEYLESEKVEEDTVLGMSVTESISVLFWFGAEMEGVRGIHGWDDRLRQKNQRRKKQIRHPVNET